MLSTGFGSEFASRCSDVCIRWLLNTCLPTANPSPASLVVATCDQLTVVISTSHVWDLLRTEDVHLHTPALRIGTHFLLILETVVYSNGSSCCCSSSAIIIVVIAIVVDCWASKILFLVAWVCNVATLLENWLLSDCCQHETVRVNVASHH